MTPMIIKSNTPKLWLMGTLGALLAVSLFQWAHFHWYYRQPSGLSLYWSLVDWTVWFLLAFGAYRLARHSVADGKLFGLAVAFVLLAGVLQITLSSVVYAVVPGSDKSLWQSVVHLMDKRWFQNLFIAIVFWMVIAQLLTLSRRQASVDEPREPSATIRLDDGQRVHWTDAADILYVGAARNYVTIHTRSHDREIVVRSSLKALKAQLDGRFIQISRSLLINREHVQRLEKYSRSSYRVVLHGEHELNVGRTYLTNLEGLQH